MFPLVLSSGASISAVADSEFDCSFACTYIQGEEVHTVSGAMTLTSATLLEAPTSGSRIVRQLTLYNHDTMSQRVAIELSGKTIAYLRLPPQQTFTLSGAYDSRGRLNSLGAADTWGTTETVVLTGSHGLSTLHEAIGRFFVFNGSSTSTFYVHSFSDLPIGARVYVANVGTGDVDLVPTGSVRFNESAATVTLQQWQLATLHLYDTDKWLLNIGAP